MKHEGGAELLCSTVRAGCTPGCGSAASCRATNIAKLRPKSYRTIKSEW